MMRVSASARRRSSHQARRNLEHRGRSMNGAVSGTTTACQRLEPAVPSDRVKKTASGTSGSMLPHAPGAPMYLQFRMINRCTGVPCMPRTLR
jgi:hypothetical protein